MNIKEYEKWSVENYSNCVCDTNVEIVRCGGKVFVLNKETGNTGVADIESTRELAVAIAYAKCIGQEVPELNLIPEITRVGYGNEYYSINAFGYSAAGTDTRDAIDNDKYEIGNYFTSKEHSKSVAEKFRMLLKLETYKAALCPDYEPNWEDDTYKYTITKYHENGNDFEYKVTPMCRAEDFIGIYFPTEEMAQMVCDALNRTLEEKSLEE